MINSQQIGNIKTFNSLMGGLATNTSSLLMGGNANLNLLSYKGVGMLEFSFGKDGIKSKIGMGGTNISMQNLVGAFGGATNLHKNSQINNTGYVKTTLDALRSQWGFGDEVAKDQLDDIINGDTVLKFDAAGSGVAQSVTENGQKVIHLNSSQNNGFIDLGLTLQHEAHRDGIVSDEQSQYTETINAVQAHTQMVEKLIKDPMYFDVMQEVIANNQDLQLDLLASKMGQEVFESYVNSNYDSSADYWKLMDDGSLAYDGKANLYDENGNLIYKTDSQGIQGSLQEILGLENQTEAYNLMIQAGMKWDGKSWINSENSTDGSLAIKMDMTTGEDGTGRTYQEIYKTRELTDSTTGYTATLEQHNPYNIYMNMVANGTMDIRQEYQGLFGGIKAYMNNESKYISYEEFKDNNYITGGMPEEGSDYQVGDPLNVQNGNYNLITTTFLAEGNMGLHYGIDISATENSFVYAMLFNDSAETVFTQDINGLGGNYISINMDLLYTFKGEKYEDTILQRYMHLNDFNQNSLDNFTMDYLALSGNTGKMTTAPHLHIDISSLQTSPWLNYMSKNYNYNSYYNFNTGRTYYAPEMVLNNYKWKNENAKYYNK